MILLTYRTPTSVQWTPHSSYELRCCRALLPACLGARPCITPAPLEVHRVSGVLMESECECVVTTFATHAYSLSSYIEARCYSCLTPRRTSSPKLRLAVQSLPSCLGDEQERRTLPLSSFWLVWWGTGGDLARDAGGEARRRGSRSFRHPSIPAFESLAARMSLADM